MSKTPDTLQDLEHALTSLMVRPESLDHVVWLVTGSPDPRAFEIAHSHASLVDVGTTNLGDLLTWTVGGLEVLLERFGRKQARRFVCMLAWVLVQSAREDVRDVRMWVRQGKRFGLERDHWAAPMPGERVHLLDSACQFEMKEVYPTREFDVSGDLCCALFHDERPPLHWEPSWELHTFEDFGELRAAVARRKLEGVRLDPGRSEQWLAYLERQDLEVLATGVRWRRRGEAVSPEYAMQMGDGLCLELCGLTLAQEPSWLDLQHNVPPEFTEVFKECVLAFHEYALARHYDRQVREMRTRWDELLLEELELALSRPHPQDSQMPEHWSEWRGFEGGERDWVHAASALVLIRWEDARRKGARMLQAAWFGREDVLDIYLEAERTLVVRSLSLMSQRLGEPLAIAPG